ncbi:MAG: hypothetical protein U0531_06650 [Dehalococcoidia bacterium]
MRSPFLNTDPSGVCTRCTRRGSISTPSLAAAAATGAVLGVTDSCPWPKPVLASSTSLNDSPGLSSRLVASGRSNGTRSSKARSICTSPVAPGRTAISAKVALTDHA